MKNRLLQIIRNVIKPFIPKTLWDLVKRSVRSINSNLLQAFSYATFPLWRNTKCVFILSTGRTGTMTLANLLKTVDEIDAHHEPYPLLLLERKHARAEIYANKKKYKHIFIQSRGIALFNAYRHEKLYAETSARLTFFAPVIAELMPNAKFIYIHRNPAEIVRSGMRRGWYIDHPADFARITPVSEEPYFKDWKNSDQFSKICWYWDAYNKFSLRFYEEIGKDRILKIEAFELFNGTAVQDIFNLISVKPPADNEVDQVLNKKLNAQKNSDFPKPDNWTNDMYDILLEIAGETMSKLGYRTAVNSN